MASRSRKTGFTLVELMIVVAILGILAAIAIPTFIMLMNRTKTGEVAANLNNMFKSAASYYSAERSGKGGSGGVTAYCLVGQGGPDPVAPSAQKQKMLGTDPSLRAIGFTIADFVYFSYRLMSPAAAGTGTCGYTAQSMELYTFIAHGDLDNDGTESTFEMAAGSDINNVMYHSVGFYVVDEME